MAESMVETVRLLVVTRGATLLRPLNAIAKSNSWHVEQAASAWDAIERIQSGEATHLLLLDLPSGEADGLHSLRWLRRLRPDLPVIVACDPEDATAQKEAIRLGADAVLTTPMDERHLEVIVRRHLSTASKGGDVEIASEDIESVGEDEFFLSASPVMHKLRAQAELLAHADVPVLILGEPGSGKGTVARLIHKLSVRSGFAFLRVNCATLPGELLEVELFGRSRMGVEDGMNRARPGKLELGRRGTLLLDEITEMPLSLQEKLVQVLQHRQFVRPEGEDVVAADVRILAATSAKLDRALAEKRLREDLYYRLSAFTVHVPPIRHRKDEIKVLLKYLMHKLARCYGLPARDFTPSVLEACVNHAWPGNLEELETFAKRYLLAGDEGANFGGFEMNSRKPSNGSSHPLRMPANLYEELEDAGDATPESLKVLIQNVKSEAEKNAIVAALEKTAWNRKAAARLLRVSYRTLLYKIEQYRLSASRHIFDPGNSRPHAGEKKTG